MHIKDTCSSVLPPFSTQRQRQHITNEVGGIAPEKQDRSSVEVRGQIPILADLSSNPDLEIWPGWSRASFLRARGKDEVTVRADPQETVVPDNLALTPICHH